MASISSFDETHLEAICQVLGETADELTESQIGRYLNDCGIPDLLPTHTKRHRLFEALRAKQRQDHCANNVVAFIKKVMSPVLFHSNPERYEILRTKLNSPTAFSGYQVNEKGDVVLVTAATRTRSISDACGTTQIVPRALESTYAKAD